MTVNGGISFWHAEMGGPPAPRAALPGDACVDVCIVGAGYTGLWAAYYLRRADPFAARDGAGAAFCRFWRIGAQWGLAVGRVRMVAPALSGQRRHPRRR
jgi:glycine/D-amino acid oxidase-like deaminating enzyme